MKRTIILAALSLCCLCSFAQNGKLPVSWAELTGPDFVKAVQMSEGVCILPMGVLEKHGPHMPLSADCIQADYISKAAAELEYAIVFPTFYVGQINEAKHQPGTVAYSPELCMRMLEETCSEIARNGCKKIIIFNIHGGNTALVQLFCQNQLYSERDYVVYQVTSNDSPELRAEIAKRIKTYNGSHAGERETSEVMSARPDLVKLDQSTSQDGKALGRLPLGNLRPSIFWYADYPNHYAGDASQSSVELGEFICTEKAKLLAEKIKVVKADKVGPALQAEFFEKSKHPIDTEQ